jgi:hypothetical protein
MVLYLVGALVIFVGAILAVRFAFSSSSEEGAGNGATPTPVVEHEEEGPTEPPVDDGLVAIELLGLPPGASVRLDGLPTATFPLRLRRGTSHTLEVSAAGYQTREIQFTADTDKQLSGHLRPAVGMP